MIQGGESARNSMHTPEMSLKSPTGEGAIAALEAAGIQTVHVGILDIDSCLRERRLPLSQAIAALRGPYSFPNVVFKWDTGETVYDPTETFQDEAARIDPTTARRYPFEPNAALFIADFIGPSAEIAPRSVLRRQIERADALGYAVQAGIECEFTVLAETASSLREKGFHRLQPWAPDNRCYAGDTAAAYADLVTEIEGLARQLDIPLYSLGTELGPGCLEATLLAREPLAAADDFALFRGFTKAFCRNRGLTASFMAQLGEGFQGLSGHVHLSLRDRDGKAVFADTTRSDGMSATMRHFIGGLLQALPDFTAMCAHTVNAYRRMVPGNWAPRTPTWGFRNYSVAVRAVTGEPSTTRIEFRVPAADTNPHLAMAMMLGAGLRGIERRIEPPPSCAGDARAIVPEGLRPLPGTLDEAAGRLASCAEARSLFGDAFVEHFAMTRRHEDAVLRRHVSAAERARYLEAL
ncbi:MAG TPA: glutamine synthetase family protein [Alphaproteobacteria bacterium]|nr:glutamine synthetase family protein [Alphaproteobacteria bacterium]